MQFSLSANLENLALDPFQLRFRSSSLRRTHNRGRHSWRLRQAETANSTRQRASVLNLDVNGCFSMSGARDAAVNCSMYVISFTTGWSKHSNIYILSNFMARKGTKEHETNSNMHLALYHRFRRQFCCFAQMILCQISAFVSKKQQYKLSI